MIARIIVLVSLLATLVSAHFQIDYPYWRGNSFLAPASQYTYPCAGLNQSESANNRTLWPLKGGSLNIDFHHPFTYVFINLGLGSNVSNFKITLNQVSLLYNESGKGTLCLPKLLLPSDLGIVDGTNASIQISTVGDQRAALYNCADITFSDSATLLSGDQCVNSTGVSISQINQEFNGSITSTANGFSNGTTKSGSSRTVNRTSFIFTFTIVVAFAVAFSSYL